jgi:hypothetical protein
MGSSDLELLIDMGFEKVRAEMAVKKTGGCKYLSSSLHGFKADA